MSDEGMVLVDISGVSEPSTVFALSRDTKPSLCSPSLGGFGTNTVPVPRVLWEEYERAADVLAGVEARIEAFETAYAKKVRG